MAANAEVHVVSKADISQHKTISIPISLSTLKTGHVRARSAIVSLTNTNMSYSLLGSFMHWWDAFPVPSDLPPPYNDKTAFGICPTWGYAEILESKIEGIEPGMFMWGMWASSSLPVDLQLQPAEAKGHFREVSDGRKAMFAMYNRYQIIDPTMRLAALSHHEIESMGWESCMRPVWEAGYVLNRGIFGAAHVEPSRSGPWSEDDADLSSAVVINLSAASKTGRSISEAILCHRPSNQHPLGFIAISSSAKASLVPESAIPNKSISYETAVSEDTTAWIKAKAPKKVVIVDCGGREDSIFRLCDNVKSNLPDAKLVVIGVGSDPSMSTMADFGKRAKRNTAGQIPRVQMNTTGVSSALIEAEGEQAYFDGYYEAWNVYNKTSCVHDLRVKLGSGIAGADGFEAGFDDVRDGKVPSDIALAYRID